MLCACGNLSLVAPCARSDHDCASRPQQWGFLFITFVFLSAGHLIETQIHLFKYVKLNSFVLLRKGSKQFVETNVSGAYRSILSFWIKSINFLELFDCTLMHRCINFLYVAIPNKELKIEKRIKIYCSKALNNAWMTKIFGKKRFSQCNLLSKKISSTNCRICKVDF